jgi:hypothetical protein
VDLEAGAIEVAPILYANQVRSVPPAGDVEAVTPDDIIRSP